jgi:hypothetical protein
MLQDKTPSNPERSTTYESLVTGKILRQSVLSVVLLTLVVVQPVAAQSNAICSADNLPSMIEGFFQLTTGLGIIGLAVVWQADSLMEMFTLNPDQKKGLKRHKRSATKSAAVLVVLGPLYTVAGPMMGLPLAQCINLAPW